MRTDEVFTIFFLALWENIDRWTRTEAEKRQKCFVSRSFLGNTMLIRPTSIGKCWHPGQRQDCILAVAYCKTNWYTCVAKTITNQATGLWGHGRLV
jgi:hypothetical protein